MQEAEGKQKLPPLSGLHPLQPLLVHDDRVRPEDTSFQPRRWLVGDLCFDWLTQCRCSSLLFVSQLHLGVCLLSQPRHYIRLFTTVFFVSQWRDMVHVLRHSIKLLENTRPSVVQNEILVVHLFVEHAPWCTFATSQAGTRCWAGP